MRHVQIVQGDTKALDRLAAGIEQLISSKHALERHRAEVRARIRQLQRLEKDLPNSQSAGWSHINPADCDPSGIC